MGWARVNAHAGKQSCKENAAQAVVESKVDASHGGCVERDEYVRPTNPGRHLSAPSLAIPYTPAHKINQQTYREICVMHLEALHTSRCFGLGHTAGS